MKTRNGPQSGKRGKIVASRNHSGPYERAHTPPKKDPTPAQERSQAEFGAVAKAWGEITDEQRHAWNAQAKRAKSKSRLGQKWPLTGQTYFIRVNNARAGFGLGLLTDPPPLEQPSLNPVGRLTITNRGGRVALRLEIAEPPAADIMVFGSEPCNRGVSKCFKCPRLGPLPAPVGGLSDITRLYVKKHGMPPVGKRVFIRTHRQNGGARDQFRENQRGRSCPAGPGRPGKRGLTPTELLRNSYGYPTEQYASSWLSPGWYRRGSAEWPTHPLANTEQTLPSHPFHGLGVRFSLHENLFDACLS